MVVSGQKLSTFSQWQGKAAGQSANKSRNQAEMSNIAS